MTGRLERAAAAMTALAERWVPDAFVFALVATVGVVAAGMLSTGGGAAGALAVVDAWGHGFWDLLAFTLQMALVIVTGYVLASSPPVYRLIRALASRPRTGRGAVALVAAFALASSWLNWGFSLVFSAMLALEIARRLDDVDYRALAAASFLGLGSVWAQGLSGSAALQMASPGSLPPRVREIVAAGGAVPGGVITLSHTIFLWQSLASVATELVVVTAVMWLATPATGRGRSARALGIALGPSPLDAPATDGAAADGADAPAGRLERSPLLTVLVVALGALYLGRYFASSPEGLGALTLDTLNLAFLLLGFALHGTPARLLRAVRDATPAVWGVLLQFPFYAGIAAVIVATHLNDRLAAAFVALSSRATFPPLVALYSALLGVLVPSGGSKWVIEAPYVMAAAHTLHVHLGWTVACYDLGEALANLVQPFWMLPVLGLFRLRARDVMGYTFVVFLVLAPLVIALVTLLGLTLAYPL